MSNVDDVGQRLATSKTYLLEVSLLGEPCGAIFGGQTQPAKLPTLDRISLIRPNKLRNVKSYPAVSGYTGEAMIAVEVLDKIDTAFGPLFVIHDPGTVGAHVGIPSSRFIEQLPARELKRAVLAAARQKTTSLEDATWNLLSNGAGICKCGRQYDFVPRDQLSDEEWELLRDAWVNRDLVRKGGRRRYAPDDEAWLLERRREGLLIDPETAEVDWSYGFDMDPYGLDPDLPEELRQVGRQYFARGPGSDIWVWFGDLPDDIEERLWKKRSNDLAFPAGLPWISQEGSETPDEFARSGSD